MSTETLTSSSGTGAPSTPVRTKRAPRAQISAPGPTAAEPAPVLCIDLDGTLIRGDLLHEGLAKYLGRNPLRLPRVLGWLLRGRRVLKERLAAAVEVDAEVLPLRDEVVQLAEQARAEGRRVLLVTAAAEREAARVAGRVGIFDEVVASGPEHGNLAGDRKAAYLVARFGESGYEYVGDSRRDLPVWGRPRRGSPSASPRRFVVDSRTVAHRCASSTCRTRTCGPGRVSCGSIR